MVGLTPWLLLLAGGLALAAGIVLWGAVERRRFEKLLVASVDEATEQLGAEMVPHPFMPLQLHGNWSPSAALQAGLHIDLHEKYAVLAETDPKLAGQMKYVEQLARHGA